MGWESVRAGAREWSAGLVDLHERFLHRFARTEPRESALAYMRGLVAPLERKNGWTFTEEAGHAGPDRIHRLLNRIEWDADEVLDDVRDYVVEHLGDPDAVLIVDDTGFLKKGVRSAGVQRQYSGTAGRTENCQIGVFLAYATGRGRTLIDRRLYLPTSWTDDRERCRRAGIADEIAFETKVAMAKAMVRRAIAENIPFRWVTADAGLPLQQRLTARTRAGRHLSRHGHHPARHRRHPLGHRPPRPRPVPRSAPPEVETSFLRQRRSRTTRVRLGPRRGPALAPARPAALGYRPPKRPPARGDLLLHRLLPRRHHTRRPDPHRREPLGDRGMLPDRPPSRNAAWTTTRSAATTAGTATSPWRWPHTPA
ncbi:IS701 family transposase [Streptomyces sp. NPDC055709]